MSVKTIVILTVACLATVAATLFLFMFLGQGAATQPGTGGINANERPDQFSAGTYYGRPVGGGESVVEVVNGTMPREIRVSGDFDASQDRIVYAKDESLFLVPPSGGELEIVVEGAGKISSFVLSKDGGRALVKGAAGTYYSVDLATGKSQAAESQDLEGASWLPSTRKTVARASA